MPKTYRSNASGEWMGTDLHELTMEEELVDIFRRFGRPIAVGRPGERFSFPGADRVYLPHDNWMPVVSELIRRARLVIIVGETTESTLWELTETWRLLPYPRLVILAYGNENSYNRFRTAARMEFHYRTLRSGDRETFPITPEFPDPPPTGRVNDTEWRGGLHFSFSGPIWGAIRFRLDGTSQFIRLNEEQDLEKGGGSLLGGIGSDFLTELSAELVALGDPAPLRSRITRGRTNLTGGEIVTIADANRRSRILQAWRANLTRRETVMIVDASPTYLRGLTGSYIGKRFLRRDRHIVRLDRRSMQILRLIGVTQAQLSENIRAEITVPIDHLAPYRP